MQVHIPKSDGNLHQTQTLGLQIDEEVGILLLSANIYTDKAIGAQEYPSNGRDAIRKLRSMAQTLEEDLAILRALQEGTRLDEAVKAHARYGLDAARASIPQAQDEDPLAEYRPAEALTRGQRDELIAHLVEVQARVREFVAHHEPLIVMDLSDPAMVQFTDNGCGMTREIIDKVFRHYGRSDKRNRKGAQLTGGFGIGAKSGFAVADAFELITRSVETDETLHVLVTKKGIQIRQASRPLPTYGTIVQVPLADPTLRAAYQEKFRLKVAHWTERCLVRHAPNHEDVASGRAYPWEGEDVIVKAKGEGWQAAILPRSRNGRLDVDMMVVDNIPFLLDEQTFPRFRLVVHVEDQHLIRLPATRETIQKDDHRAALQEAVKKALQKEASRNLRRLAKEAQTAGLDQDIAALLRRLRGQMVLNAYIHQGGVDAEHVTFSVNVDEPHQDSNIELEADPRSTLTARALGVLQRLGERATWEQVLHQEYRLTEEECQSILFLEGRNALGNGESFVPGNGKYHPGYTRPTMTLYGPDDASYVVPSWVRFMSARLPAEKITLDEEGEPAYWTLHEAPLAALFRPQAPRMHILCARTSLPGDRDGAFQKLLGGELPEGLVFSSEATDYLGDEPVEEVRVLVTKGRMTSWLSEWGIFNARKLPADKREKQPGGGRIEDWRDMRVALITDKTTATHTRLGDLDLETPIVLLEPHEEHAVRGRGFFPYAPPVARVPAPPEEDEFEGTRPVYFMRSPAPSRRKALEEQGAQMQPFAEFKEGLAELTFNTLRTDAGTLARGPSVRLAQLLEGEVRAVSLAGSSSLSEAIQKASKGPWVRRLPSSTLLVGSEALGTVRTIGRFLGREVPESPSPEEAFLALHSDVRSRMLVRMSFGEWRRRAYSLTFANREEPDSMPLEFWLIGSPRDLMERTDAAAKIVHVLPLPPEPAATPEPSPDPSEAGDAEGVAEGEEGEMAADALF